VPAGPRWRFRKASLREFAALLPWLVAVVVVDVVVGRRAAFGLLGLLVVVATVRLAVTGSSPALRRAGITYVRLGTRARPARWRLVVFRLGPVVLLVPLIAASTWGSAVVFAVALAAYVGLWVAGFVKARRHGPDLDPMLALAGLDVWWLDGPPTPSGTSGPPAPAPPPPTPAAPATPDPAPRRGRRGRR
jgi:hypothetical protein